MIRTSILLFSKRITIPRLSPTHTQSKVTKFLVQRGDYIEPYDVVFHVRCSPDLVTAGLRDSPNQEIIMIVENQEDGTITSLDTNVIGKWLDVDTAIGVIDDGEEEMDGDWTWQAYTTSQEEDSLKS